MMWTSALPGSTPKWRGRRQLLLPLPCWHLCLTQRCSETALRHLCLTQWCPRKTIACSAVDTAHLLYCGSRPFAEGFEIGSFAVRCSFPSALGGRAFPLVLASPKLCHAAPHYLYGFLYLLQLVRHVEVVLPPPSSTGLNCLPFVHVGLDVPPCSFQRSA